MRTAMGQVAQSMLLTARVGAVRASCVGAGANGQRGEKNSERFHQTSVEQGCVEWRGHQRNCENGDHPEHRLLTLACFGESARFSRRADGGSHVKAVVGEAKERERGSYEVRLVRLESNEARAPSAADAEQNERQGSGTTGGRPDGGGSACEYRSSGTPPSRDRSVSSVHFRVV